MVKKTRLHKTLTNAKFKLFAKYCFNNIIQIKNLKLIQNTLFMGPTHYMTKKNHPRGLFDSFNEAFWCTDYNAKNLRSLQSPISEKIKKNLKKIAFLKKWYFLPFLRFFSEMGLRRELRCFAVQSVHQNSSFKLWNDPLGWYSFFAI